MAVLRRLRRLLRGHVGRLMAADEEPAAVLELAYAREVERLQEVRTRIAEVVTAERQVSVQRTQIERSRERLDALAREALAHGNRDGAVAAVTHGELLVTQLEGLGEQRRVLDATRLKLEGTLKQLELRLTTLRAEKDALRVQYIAARATERAGSTALGLDAGDVELRAMLERARERVLATRARADAVDRLLRGGGAEAAERDLDSRLAELHLDSAVEERMRLLDGEMRALPAAGGSVSEADGGSDAG